jgi:hypothetical protein
MACRPYRSANGSVMLKGGLPHKLCFVLMARIHLGLETQRQ